MWAGRGRGRAGAAAAGGPGSPASGAAGLPSPLSSPGNVWGPYDTDDEPTEALDDPLVKKARMCCMLRCICDGM